ncbi:MAG: hypothetical protein FWH19_02220 [Treponema sp.]|nr:hypothetical protein [Treponema sp.]
MSKRIFNFDLDGKAVLGFDTGLKAKGFAQAKLGLSLTHSGSIVYPSGETESWRAGGVAERESMVVWGPSFPGELLTELITDPNRKDEALNALRFWLKARILIEAPYSSPAGALVITRQGGPFPIGTVLFPPERLVRRSLEAEGAAFAAEAWVHPELDGEELTAFSAAAMLYGIFCGAPPFSGDTENALRQNIREGVFVPPQLAAPGLEPEMAALISLGISRRAAPTSPNAIIEFTGPPFSRQVSSWFKPLSDEEAFKIHAERGQYIKKKNRAVKRRRFVIRNTAAIAASIIIFFVLSLFVRGMIRHRAELPTTRGMAPIEVVEAYYNAFNDLDHVMMTACVTGGAGREDIDMVINFFVINRVRQAYEGGPLADRSVFGIRDLSVRLLSETDSGASLEADYTLWLPGTELDEESGLVLPTATLNRDLLQLTFERDLWRITNIEREQLIDYQAIVR